ncbi:MAG TPA: glycosyltransferase family 2 protein [Gemmatimonadaceae bacterium]|nr:glycosyltransferase family 2 protein [Gemmatimonadaceae bacterium]
MTTTPPVLSIVTTVYNSADTLESFYERMSKSAASITADFEIVIVDDGSPDDSLAMARGLAARDPRVVVVELSRNFGHHKALMTGLDFARGEICLFIDSDLEEPPELLPTFWTMLHQTDADVIYGYQVLRGGNVVRRLTGGIAFWLFKALIPYDVPRNLITLRLMRRSYVDSLLLHRERQTVIGGLWVITGYKQLGVPVEKEMRRRTTYGLRRRWSLLIDSITSFSEVPLIGIFYLGMIISLLAAAMGIWLLIRKAVSGVGVEGWVSVMLSVWFLGGLSIFCLGIIGIYLSKIFIETKQRPYTLVRAVYGGAADARTLGRRDDPRISVASDTGRR